MSEDFRHNRTSSDPEFTDDDYNEVLLDIESQLQAFPKSKTEDYGLPATREITPRVDPLQLPSEVRDALNFNTDNETMKRDELLSKFNDEQIKTFNEINDSVMKDEGRYVSFSMGQGDVEKQQWE